MKYIDEVGVDKLAECMKEKLAQKRHEGRGGWYTDECSQDILSDMLRQHVEKGDPIDVANFCMMLYMRGERIK